MVAETAPGRYFEDFQVGDQAPPVERTIEAAEIRQFIDLLGLTQPLFTDDETARAAGHRGVIAPGPVLLSYALGSLSPSGWTKGTTIGLFGVDGARFKRPLYAGDRVTITNQVVSKRASGKPGRGYVTFHVQATNQDGEILLQCERTILVKSRPST